MQQDLDNLSEISPGMESGDSRSRQVIRRRVQITGLVSVFVYVGFATYNYLSYSAEIMATISGLAALLTLGAIIAAKRSTSNTLGGQLFTLGLTVQVLGEMLFNGGMMAPAAALCLLIVPSSIFTIGISQLRVWTAVSIIGLLAVGVLDYNGILSPNELPPSARLVDQILSMVAGITVFAMLLVLYEREATNAITQLAEERSRFHYRSLHDELTGMPNRRQFYERAKQSINDAKPMHERRVVLYFDIDRFKQVNDTYGHEAGDLLLIEFAGRVQAKVHSDDIPARLAGDEFALMASIPHGAKSIKTMEKTLKSIVHEPFELPGTLLDVGMSIGHACFPEDGDDLNTLLRVADERMYQDKFASVDASNVARSRY